ncbi:MAG: hypothetical protein ACYTAO_13620 [Planctomycetota bacterium]|jgi:hypothetical protein
MQAQLALHGFYGGVDDPFGALRFSAGDRKQNPLDLVVSNPAVSPFALPVCITFRDVDDIDSTNIWTEGSAGSGTPLAIQDAIGNKAKFTNGALDNNYYSYEYKYEKAQLRSGKDVWFITTIEIADVDQADMFVGLMKKLGSGTLFDNRVDCIGLTLTDGSGILQGVCTKDGIGSPTSPATADILTLADATQYWVGFHSNGTTAVDFFAGPVSTRDQPAWRQQIRTNLPDDEILAPAFGLRNGQASANDMSITDMWIFMDP